MKDTRYWKKGVGAIFYSKCKDQGPGDDGRQLYKYTKPVAGERWQYESRHVGGMMESLYMRESQYGEDLNIGLNSGDRVNVLQIPIWADKKEGKLSTEFKSFAMRIPNIDINEEIDFGLWANLEGKRTWEKDGQKFSHIPVYLVTYQDGGAMRKSVKSAFTYVNGEYEGLPAVPSTEFAGRKIFDFTERNNFLIKLVEDFAADHKDEFDRRQAVREATPAEEEVSVALSGNVDDDDDLQF